MMIDDDIRALIMEKSDATVIKRAALTKGMISLRESGIQAVLNKVTSAVELVSVTQE